MAMPRAGHRRLAISASARSASAGSRVRGCRTHRSKGARILAVAGAGFVLPIERDDMKSATAVQVTIHHHDAADRARRVADPIDEICRAPYQREGGKDPQRVHGRYRTALLKANAAWEVMGDVEGWRDDIGNDTTLSVATASVMTASKARTHLRTWPKPGRAAAAPRPRFDRPWFWRRRPPAKTEWD